MEIASTVALDDGDVEALAGQFLSPIESHELDEKRQRVHLAALPHQQHAGVA